MQFWKDETTPFQYGGVVRHDSKVLLYVMFRLKAVLKTVDFKFHHYAVKATTTWNDYTRKNLTSEQVTADRKAHQKTHDELTTLKNWMQRRYQEEADLEQLDAAPLPRGSSPGTRDFAENTGRCGQAACP